jgi:hypothetical protein
MWLLTALIQSVLVGVTVYAIVRFVQEEVAGVKWWQDQHEAMKRKSTWHL